MLVLHRILVQCILLSHHMDVFSTLERLVAIPSWRAPDNPDVEAGVSGYLTEVIQRTLPWMRITHQHVVGKRYNIFATDGSPTDLLLVGHLDTKPPGESWTHRATGERAEGRMYGRGTFDSKGGIVALLSALAAIGPTRGVGLLLYCDEVYEFHGMRAFLAEAHQRIQPSLVVAVEPTQLEVWNGCRGVGEFRPVVRGKQGFAAKPENGHSALSGFIRGIHSLEEFATTHEDPEFGCVTSNVASLRGGQSRGNEDGREVLAEERNIIPDYAEGVIEVRTVPGITLRSCMDAFANGVALAGSRVTTLQARFDLDGYYVAPDRIRPLTDAITAVMGSTNFANLGTLGYSDVQLLSSALKVPVAMFGPIGGNVHAAEEFVELESLKTVQAVFQKMVSGYRQRP
jgi:acetylornithine deacetylase/succinyl-diaminopimelate desuccinylase-like protein